MKVTMIYNVILVTLWYAGLHTHDSQSCDISLPIAMSHVICIYACVIYYHTDGLTVLLFL